LPWSLTSRSDHEVTLVCVVHPQPAYPWRLELQVRYALEAKGLVVTATATNLSDARAPFGIGFHPYVAVGGRIDEALLSVPARRRLITDERGLPTGDEGVAGTAFDFLTTRPIDQTRLDTGYTDLVRADDGRAWAEVAAADGSRVVGLWADDAFPYLMVYTGDTLAPASRRRQGIAIEPMSCPPNALRSGSDLVGLEPGSRWTGSWGIAPAISSPSHDAS
jgi:aldose 1-epimerase